MKKLLPLLALVLVAAGLAACGGSDDSTSSESTAASAADTTSTSEELPLLDDAAGDEHVRYSADLERPNAFHISEASASPGRDTIEFVNPTNVVHNLAVEAPNGKTIAQTKKIGYGRTSTKAVLKENVVYVVYCTVPGHRKAGMVGHLTVFPQQ